MRLIDTNEARLKITVAGAYYRRIRLPPQRLDNRRDE
jgi:hypothetical protein